ncbi:MAG TPA: hypothetical protein VNH43_11530, partial [Vicinamibacteria bacterium]|nr:hypothetical protein [Vicinamibacteria bacterium]
SKWHLSIEAPHQESSGGKVLVNTGSHIHGHIEDHDESREEEACPLAVKKKHDRKRIKGRERDPE